MQKYNAVARSTCVMKIVWWYVLSVATHGTDYSRGGAAVSGVPNTLPVREHHKRILIAENLSSELPAPAKSIYT
jgi:hypothetical protein